MTDAQVSMWGSPIGAVSWDEGNSLGQFEYVPEFADSGIRIAPLTMPPADRVYAFPTLSRDTFRGLPGLLADSLPDRFGNALIDAWLATQGRRPDSFNPVERLCYTGGRGMGALEYSPAMGPVGDLSTSVTVEIEALVELANKALAIVAGLEGSFDPDLREDTLLDILRVGTSAGGARAKALIAYNEETGEVRSGQVRSEEGFTYWLLKFDGVKDSDGDRYLGDPQGYGLIEHAYFRMARAAGVDMQESRILEDRDGRSHFMTKRFDRTDNGARIHMQSLGAMRHFDFNQPNSYSYEQAFQTITNLGLPKESVERMFRRMAFNVIARNQDDHVKNVAFLMDRPGDWSLSPAYDMTYSYGDAWTKQHQMSVNGKRDGFTIEDFRACAKTVAMKRGRAEDIVREVQEAVQKWEDFAAESKVPQMTIDMIAQTHRTGILK